MPATRTYYTLVTSLPHMRAPFFHERTPLSRLRLERRLRMLEPEDAETLARVERMLSWTRLPFGVDDETLVASTLAELDALAPGPIRELAEWRLAARTILAGLRRRQRGEGPPARDVVWGYPSVAHRIRRHWEHPDFTMGGEHPWVKRVARLFEHYDPVARERAILMAVWAHLDRVAVGHRFDLVAVVVYVMRWHLVDRWTCYDADRGLERFERLAHAGLGEHAALFA